MTRTLPSRLLFLVSLCLLLPLGARAEDIKKIHPTGYVTDLASALTPQAKAQLEALCLELEQKTGAQMAIVTVHSLEGDEAPVYANKLFKQLGVGGKKDDRGVLLLVAPDEHHYWTEVGYGLEPVINDARAGDAGRTMVPYFKQGDYSGGIQAGAWQLAKYIAEDRNVTLSGQPQIQTRPSRHEDGIPFTTWLILGFVVFSILARAIGSLSGRGGRSGGGGSGCLWFLLGMLASSSGGRSSGGGDWGGGGFGGGGGGFGGFGGGSSGGGGAGGSW